MTIERPVLPPDPGEDVPGFKETLLGMPRRVYRSIFRSRPVPRTELERSRAFGAAAARAEKRTAEMLKATSVAP